MITWKRPLGNNVVGYLNNIDHILCQKQHLGFLNFEYTFRVYHREIRRFLDTLFPSWKVSVKQLYLVCFAIGLLRNVEGIATS